MERDEPHTIIASVTVPDDVADMLRDQMERGGFNTVGDYLAYMVRKENHRIHGSETPKPLVTQGTDR